MGGSVGVFCCKGLGDGLISLILAHNLQRNGFEVKVFHPFLKGLQEWFPEFSIEPIPNTEAALAKLDKLFFFYEKTEEMLPLLEKALALFPEKTTVLNPIATTKQDYPFWESGKFDGSLTFADNLLNFCSSILKLEGTQKNSGIKPPFSLTFKLHHRRIVIHPTSSREGKNWPKEKYLKLSKRLKLKGFDPFFALSAEERLLWPEVHESVFVFEHLEELASFVYESGYMIGNDSGIGHLASCLGVPTMTICRSYKSIAFWKPSYGRGIVIHPPKWIPNLKVFRFRDIFWKKIITINAVEKAFISLL